MCLLGWSFAFFLLPLSRYQLFQLYHFNNFVHLSVFFLCLERICAVCFFHHCFFFFNVYFQLFSEFSLSACLLIYSVFFLLCYFFLRDSLEEIGGCWLLSLVTIESTIFQAINFDSFFFFLVAFRIMQLLTLLSLFGSLCLPKVFFCFPSPTVCVKNSYFSPELLPPLTNSSTQ